jgi:hypothetical protein
MTDHLTTDQVIRALARLNNRWPDDLKIIVMDGTLHLCRSDVSPKANGSFNSDDCIDLFPAIHADGGGW